MAASAISRVVFVTDPLCSWCWGMASAIEGVIAEGIDGVAFDFMLGGINTHGTQPIGDYGRRRLFKLWQEVEATTGQTFGYHLPDPLLYNSTLPCRAVHAVRSLNHTAPFGYLHRLQQLFFELGTNINDADVLCAEAREFGVAPDAFIAALGSAAISDRTRFEFDNARNYGTQALPNVLIDSGTQTKLMAGGYVGADMLKGLIETWPAD